jgi:outer membrane biogenesis lipoprotein LolB
MPLAASEHKSASALFFACRGRLPLRLDPHPDDERQQAGDDAADQQPQWTDRGLLAVDDNRDAAETRRTG